MSHSQPHEVFPTLEVSQAVLPEDLVNYLREQHEMDFIVTEDFSVPVGDELRFTASLLLAEQINAIEQGQRLKLDYAWEYHQHPGIKNSYFTRGLPAEHQDPAIEQDGESPFKGTGATEAEAILNSYQAFVAYINHGVLSKAQATGWNYDLYPQYDLAATDIPVVDKPPRIKHLYSIDFTVPEDAQARHAITPITYTNYRGLENSKDEKVVYAFQAGELVLGALLTEGEALPLTNEAESITKGEAATKEEAARIAFKNWNGSRNLTAMDGIDLFLQ